MRASFTGVVAIVLLSVWLGATLCVSALVAPAAFAVLPTRTLAGALVGRVLPALFVTGITIGLGLAAIGWSATPGRGARTAATIGVALWSAVAQFVIAPRIAAIRAAVGGPIDALALADPRRAAFGRLHGMSVACLGLAMLCAIVSLALFIRLATRTPS